VTAGLALALLQQYRAMPAAAAAPAAAVEVSISVQRCLPSAANGSPRRQRGSQQARCPEALESEESEGMARQGQKS
jgi:hypothetical protein